MHFDSFLYGGFITSKGKENVLVFWDFWDTFGRFLGLFLWLVFWGFCWWFLIFSYFSAIKDIWALQSLHNHIMNVSDSRQFWGWLFEDVLTIFWQSFIYFYRWSLFQQSKISGLCTITSRTCPSWATAATTPCSSRYFFYFMIFQTKVFIKFSFPEKGTKI